MVFGLKKDSKSADNCFYVYMVECLDGSYYTGYTPDLTKRMLKHKSGKGSKYVVAKGFGKLVYFEEFFSKEMAMKREFSIKRASRDYKSELVSSFVRDVELLF